MNTDTTQNREERIPDRRQRAYADAEQSWGKDAQIIKAAEELSELSAALNRHLNGQQDRDELLQEMADGWVVLEQMDCSLFGPDEVDTAIERATDDLIDRIHEHGVTDELEVASNE